MPPMRYLIPCVLLTTAASGSPLAAQAPDSARAYQRATAGVREFALGPLAVKVLIDAATLGGGELELAEITFPSETGAGGGAHRHTRVEVIYILSGEMDHVVNDVTHHLVPGMVGIVRPGDQVAHRVTSTSPVRALVMWAPGGELPRIESR